MLAASGIIPPTIATVSSISAAASLASSAAAARSRSPTEIKEEAAGNGRAGAGSRDQEEQVDVVKTDQPAPPPQSAHQPVTRKRKLVDLDANRLTNESKHQEAKPYPELHSYSKRIKFDTLAANQSYDNQFLSTTSHSNRTNAQAADYPASLCYS